MASVRQAHTMGLSRLLIACRTAASRSSVSASASRKRTIQCMTAATAITVMTEPKIVLTRLSSRPATKIMSRVIARLPWTNSPAISIHLQLRKLAIKTSARIKLTFKFRRRPSLSSIRAPSSTSTGSPTRAASGYSNALASNHCRTFESNACRSPCFSTRQTTATVSRSPEWVKPVRTSTILSDRKEGFVIGCRSVSRVNSSRSARLIVSTTPGSVSR